MVEHGVDVGSELVGCDRGRAGECGERGVCMDELAGTQRNELADGHAVPCDDEGLSPVKRPHDVAAAVA